MIILNPLQQHLFLTFLVLVTIPRLGAAWDELQCEYMLYTFHAHVRVNDIAVCETRIQAGVRNRSLSAVMVTDQQVAKSCHYKSWIPR